MLQQCCFGVCQLRTCDTKANGLLGRDTINQRGINLQVFFQTREALHFDGPSADLIEVGRGGSTGSAEGQLADVGRGWPRLAEAVSAMLGDPPISAPAPPASPAPSAGLPTAHMCNILLNSKFFNSSTAESLSLMCHQSPTSLPIKGGACPHLLQLPVAGESSIGSAPRSTNLDWLGRAKGLAEVASKCSEGLVFDRVACSEFPGYMQLGVVGLFNLLNKCRVNYVRLTWHISTTPVHPDIMFSDTL
ncbi:hypothetical protein C8R44DRAFT_750910 [Mycena epipterygia]|nr:hypothetical protein C8R44DRAFT_750910 [Mycena epipterygia]